MTPSKKVGHRDEDTTVVTLDQTRKTVGADLYYGWFPVGERPTVKVSASRAGVNLLGAVTEHGEPEVLECGGSFTGEVTVRFLTHLQETFFEDSKQDLGLGDCEMQLEEGASRHWHLLMAAYSLVRLDPDSSASGTVRSKASSLRANLEHSLKEAVYNLLSWVRDNDDRGVDDLMEEIDHLFVHSTADANVQS